MATFSRFLWTVLPVVMLATAAIYVPVKLADGNGYQRVREIRRDLQVLRDENRRIKRENEALRNQIRAIHADPDFIENIARNEMGMIGPDEVVYQF